jgi:hypothetical protein
MEKKADPCGMTDKVQMPKQVLPLCEWMTIVVWVGRFAIPPFAMMLRRMGHPSV